ncbi:aminoacyl-tRNA hydrolase [Microvirga tunisiensis]|uniref:Peptidyl-tRNA hydrolase n=1 Tax=Pannonibacter tanglangensis TaxID=2750084 RepID=A0A7X5EZB7_9HYPH|nr:aminoacyl-tRNA hydrolase [Pannonibacter sp. XCT-53]NBN76895.1 aminoacyl-tRNA hydrolase [Pannonibacter sp. XCT-53]
MQIIVGLGNPGGQYARNRHNIGFMAVDEIHRRNPGFSPWRARFQGEASEGTLAGEKVMLLKPMTYMNESGRSVGEAMRFYKLEPKDILVLYDELDLPPAKFRMKSGGGHGGHNGLRSITAHVGDAYRRLRLGIGHPGDKKLVSNYVLGDFAKVDQEWLEPMLTAIADYAGMLARGEDSQFANKLTLVLEPEKARRPDKTAKAEKAPRPEKAENSAAGPAGDTAAAPDPVPQAVRSAPKGQSHIRQARQPKGPQMPTSGPMAEMLKKLLGKGDG